MSRGQHNTARAMTESAIITRDALRQALAYIEGSQPDQTGMHRILLEARGLLHRGTLSIAKDREALERYQYAEEGAFYLAFAFDERDYKTACRSAICSLVREAMGALDTFIDLSGLRDLSDWSDTLDLRRFHYYQHEEAC